MSDRNSCVRFSDARDVGLGAPWGCVWAQVTLLHLAYIFALLTNWPRFSERWGVRSGSNDDQDGVSAPSNLWRTDHLRSV